MKSFLLIMLAAVKDVLAGGSADAGCCKFTLSSSGPFSCPVGELQDGQLRLNGTNDTTTFCIASDGGITDSHGFGCIVTESPTTQFQCDLGKEPDKGFSINSDNVLLYHGLPKFSACPATDTEWNIYVTPDFGQAKCTPITLVADGCGAQKPSPSTCSPASTTTDTTTIWATMWSTTTQALNITVTETAPCASNTTTWGGWNSTTAPCHKCTRTPTGTFPGLAPNSTSGCSKAACSAESSPMETTTAESTTTQSSKDEVSVTIMRG